MALKEHDNNIITKEYNDPVIIYLRNIIQRYFQIENEISQESKEAIIIQAYTRLKEFLNAFNDQYIICINERSGAIDLAIKDLGGEESFDKNSAFNKDFCDVVTATKTLWDNTDEEYNNFGEEQSDHMVSGDDDRLYDARIPLAHLHTIDNISGLRDFLEGYHLLNGGFHLHTNLKFLNMLIYTGSMVSIDLILLEDLAAKVEKAVEKFQETNIYVNSNAQHYINQFNDIFAPVYNRLTDINNNINEWLQDWISESEIYTNLKEYSLRNYIVNLAEQYLSKEEYQLLKDILYKSVRVIEDKEFDVSELAFANPILNSTHTETMQGNYHGVPFNINKGHTEIALSSTISDTVSEEVLNQIYDNTVLNTVQKFYFEYEKDGIAYCDQLPHIYQVNDSRNDLILAYANVDENNNVNANFRRLSYLPVYLYHPMRIFAWVEDNTGKTNSSYLYLDNTNTTPISNDNVQQNNTAQIHDNESVNFTIRRVCMPYDAQHIQDLQAIVAPYNSGGPSGEFGAYKELLRFIIKENYTGSIRISISSIHWYGFAIWESEDGENFTEKANNYHKDNHGQLITEISNVTLIEDRTYKIITQECDRGGTDPSNFVYSINTDTNFEVIVSQEINVNVNINVNVDKSGDSARLSWTINKTHDLNGELVDDVPFRYKLVKTVDNGGITSTSTIDCGQRTSYDDTPLDTLLPLPPKITGRCVSSDEASEIYEFTIESSDQYQCVHYQLSVYADPSDKLNSGLLGQTTALGMTVTSYSDIRKIHYDVVLDSFTDLADQVDNKTYSVLDDVDLSSRSKRVTIIKDNSLPFNDRLIFCDNTYKGTTEKLTQYLDQFNIKLCTVDTLNQDYIKQIMLLQESEFPFYHIGNTAEGGTAYFDTDVFIMDEDLEWNYYGEFPYGTLNDFFPNAKIRYQIILVPGKGEDDA